jgi:hypothetical protein
MRAWSLSQKFAHVVGRRTHSLLTGRGREFGADADDCVSSKPGVSRARAETLARLKQCESGVAAAAAREWAGTRERSHGSAGA